MDWGMMQDPYKVAQKACGLGYVNPNTSNYNTAIGGSAMSKGHEQLLSDHCHHVCLRPRLRFGLTLSALIVIADSFLRFSWTLKYIAKFPSEDAFVLCTQFLEVFRRAIWNLLRVEWENIKQKQIHAKARESWSDHGGSRHKKKLQHIPSPMTSHRRNYSGSISGDEFFSDMDEFHPLTAANAKIGGPPTDIDALNRDSDHSGGFEMKNLR